MQYMDFGENSFSKITLGTAQLGMPYGISNESGMPDSTESSALLSFACQAGINTFDTARSYGKSEEVIGNFLESRRKPEALNIITKFRISDSNLSHEGHAWEEVQQSLRQSLAAIRINRFAGCLFHCAGEQSLAPALEILPSLLRRIKKEGWAKTTGISLYSSSSAELLIDVDEIEIIQVPLNLFDQQLINKGILPKLEERKKLVFARSIFLQGLFFKKPGDLTGNLTAARPYLMKLQQLAGEAGMSIAQLAFAFVRRHSAVHSMVIGAERIDQLKQNIKMLKTPPIPRRLRQEIERSFSAIDEVIYTPGDWRLG